MANRVVVQADVDNTTYSDWITAEELPSMVVGDIMLDGMTDIPNGILRVNDPATTFSTARATPTIWVDSVAIAAEGDFHSLTMGSSMASEWDEYITFRPLRDQVIIIKDTEPTSTPIDIFSTKHVKFDGACNSFPGFRNGIPGVFARDYWGFFITSEGWENDSSWNAVNIKNTFATDTEVRIRGVGGEYGFAMMRIQQETGTAAVVRLIDIQNCACFGQTGGEFLYLGSTQGGTVPTIKEIQVHNCIGRSGTECPQIQNVVDNSIRSEISRNVLMGGVAWIEPFQPFQDYDFQINAGDGNFHFVRNIGNHVGGTHSIYFATDEGSGEGTIYNNYNLWINASTTYQYHHNSLVEGLTWINQGNYILGFRDNQTRGGATEPDFLMSKGSPMTDAVQLVDTKWDDTRTYMFEGNSDYSETHINSVQASAASYPDVGFEQPGLNYPNFVGRYAKQLNGTGNFITYAIDDEIEIFTNGGGKRYYICIANHTADAGSDPAVDTTEWTLLTYDASGIRSDEVGWTSGDAQRYDPPDNFTTDRNTVYNEQDMSMPWTPWPEKWTNLKFYYADDAIGTNKVQLQNHQGGTLDLTEDANDWIARKTGKYIINSVTPVDDQGVTGTEVFSTGIIIA